MKTPRVAPLEGADTYALQGIRGYGVENRRFRSENLQGFGIDERRLNATLIEKPVP